MWWQDTTDNRMRVARYHGDELRTQAQEDRELPDDIPNEISIAVSGRHFHLGSLVIVFGRTIREEHSRRAHGMRA